jgi:hypothetical protein
MRTGRLGMGVVLALTLVATSAAQSKFTLKVHTGLGQVGYDVNSTMISSLSTSLSRCSMR